MPDMVNLGAVYGPTVVFDGIGGGVKELTLKRETWEQMGEPESLTVHTTKPAWEISEHD